jgi:beta-N-acetylhexosaminidase
MFPYDLTSLPIKSKVGQLFFVGLPGSEIDNAGAEVLGIGPGGICLFARNIREAHQTRSLLEAISKQLDVPPLLSIDQEGGTVDRLRRILEPMPAASLIRRRHEARRLATLIAESLRLLGFNMDFAPVVDVITAERSHPSNGLYSRAFGQTAEETADLAGEFLSTLALDGVVGCLKHFPGLGAAAIDSHEDLPSIELPESVIDDVDLFPYRALLDSQSPFAVMVAHSAYPNHPLQEMDSEGRPLPASLSRNFSTVLLRERLGFEGVTITDDLEMGAIIKNYGIGTACVHAIIAGADMLAICADPSHIREGYEAVLSAVDAGYIELARIDESMSRIAKLKHQMKEPLPFDPQRLSELSREIAEFKASLNQ